MFRQFVAKMKKLQTQQIDFSSYSFSRTKKVEVGEEQNNESFSRKIKNKSKSISIKKEGQLSVDSLETLKLLKSWRERHTAPVDVVGCERTYDKSQPLEIQRYQILVSLMLSIQTKDQITAMIMKRLVNFGLKPQKINKLTEEELLSLIAESNFNRRKAKNILQMTRRVLTTQMPRSSKDLMEFPGVGTKIAMIYMRVAENVNEGIGVDTHVHRISNRLGWVNTANPNQTQEQLQKLFPQEQWEGINIAMVGFGQILCEAKKPKCKQCPLAKDCPSFQPLF